MRVAVVVRPRYGSSTSELFNALVKMASGNGEIRIDDAIHTMKSGGVRNRFEGVTNLITIFKHNQNSPSLDVLKDGAYHVIYESLFKVAADEKRVYLSANTDTARSKAERALSQCSEALRITIKSGAEKLKPKTVRAIIHHVTQLLPVATGEYCLAFSQPYLKVLKTLLEHEAHVELLEQDDWLATLDFCVHGIKQLETNQPDYSAAFGSSLIVPTSSSNQTSKSSGSSKSSLTVASIAALQKKNSEELIECFLSLISSSNAPLLERTETIFDAIFLFLQSQGQIIGHLHQVAFSSLNIMVSATAADEISLSSSFLVKILPMIGRLWSSKTAANDEMLNVAKDEMAITILLARLHFEKMVLDEWSEELEVTLTEVQQSLKSDYEKRGEKDQLQLIEIDMSIDHTEDAISRTLPCGFLRLRSQNLRTERKWAVVQVLTILDGLIHGAPQSLNNAAREDDRDDLRHPRKRRRAAKRFDTLIRESASGDVGRRTLALQTFLFALPGSSITEDYLTDLISQLVPHILDKNNEISSWAMLCIASLAQLDVASSTSRITSWKQLWHTVSRAITSPGLCQAASYLLHIILAKGLLEYKDVVEGATAILTMPEISAPTTLNIASMSFLRHLLYMRNAEGSGGGATASQSVTRWLFSKWNPADKSFASRVSVDSHPIDVLNLLRAAFDFQAVKLSSPTQDLGGPIRQAWIRWKKGEKTLRFLLLLPNASIDKLQCSKCAAKSRLYEGKQSKDPLSSGQTLKRLVLDLLLPRLESLGAEWEFWDNHDSPQIPLDAFRSVVSVCVTSCLILTLVQEDVPSPEISAVDAILKRLLNLVRSPRFFTNGSTSGLEAIISVVQPYLPEITSVEMEHLHDSCGRMAELFNALSEGLKGFRSEANMASSMDDLMDMDSAFDTQQSMNRSERNRSVIEREELALSLSSGALISGSMTKLALISSFSGPAVSASFIDYIVDLSPMELVSSSNVICEVLRGDLMLDLADASKLLQCVAALLTAQQSCCEVMLNLCLDTLSGMIPMWTEPGSQKLADMASDLYTWFVKTVFVRRRPSPNVQLHLADLLFKLIKVQPLYGESQELPSVRTALFNVLQRAPIHVKFDIGERLPDIFSLFVLKTHLSILNDLLQSLPIDPEWCEGNAFRLDVLGKLASKWPTLLRSCAYYILEVSGRVPSSIPYSKRCLSQVSQDLGLKNQMELFQLFNSQFLFTWLRKDPFETIPYNIFGYETLSDLLHDNREEVTALMVMRDRDDEVVRLAEALGSSLNELLVVSFTKAIAYSIAHDISVAPSDISKRYVTGEARMRKHLGKDGFFELINEHFVDIIKTFFRSMDHEQDLERSFAKDPLLCDAAARLAEMKTSIPTDTSLPPNQQPNFRSKCLVPEINHICGRTVYELSTLFTPSLIVSVARSLFDAMHPALGSLHSCAILRKLRVLISLAGASACTGYALEMLLHSLRPLLLDAHCADDAIGIVKYLISQGRAYLDTVPSFVATTALSILGSIRVFLADCPSSTTQQSQWNETINKVGSFHAWLCQFLDSYKPPQLVKDKKVHEIFTLMIKTAEGLGEPGGADSGTPDGELLINILRDKRARAKILNKPARELALSLIYKDFKAPRSFRTDSLGDDERAVRYASTLWEVCKNESINPSINTWAGTVFGRAFAANGFIDPSLLQETRLKEMIDLVDLEPSVRPSSRIYIVGLIMNLTLVYSKATTGLAECTLRVIVSGIADEPDTTDEAVCSAVLPVALLESSTWSPYHIPPSDMLASRTPVPLDVFTPRSLVNHKWLQDLTIFLVQSVPSDPILYPLQQLLSEAAGFAEKCFPFILHIVLLSHLDGSHTIKRQLSTTIRSWLVNDDPEFNDRLRLLINAILYLRTQPLPHETSVADRTQWLDLDYQQLADASVRCGMYKSALLFVELSLSEASSASRRSSTMKMEESKEVLLSIFKNVDDPDIIYGLQQPANLQTISARLEFERNGLKTLMFKGAEFDTRLRRGGGMTSTESHSLVNALGMLSLNGLSHSLLQSQQNTVVNDDILNSMFQTARKLEQWDLPIPDTHNNDFITVYKTFQTLSTAVDRSSVKLAIDTGLSATVSNLLRLRSGAKPVHTSLQALAALTEIDEVLSACNSEEFEEMLNRFDNRSSWMKTGKFEDVSHIISSRETVLSVLNKKPALRGMLNISASDTSLVEARTSILSLSINRFHGALQESLTTATYLNSLVQPCQSLDLNIEAAASLEAANAMWDQGEVSSSIHMLQGLTGLTTLKSQTIPVAKSMILSKLAAQVAEAKLEKPDRIIEKYLSPALTELKGKATGSDAGQVYHEFAVFCDRQYQDPDSIEDLERLRVMREQKESEVHALVDMIKSAKSSAKKSSDHRAYTQAKKWLDLDNEEYDRLMNGRTHLLLQSLENYLLSLSVWNEHDNDAIRFAALWLEHSDVEITSKTVEKHISKVATYKFAGLANQLTSRLLNNPDDPFQSILFNLVLGICVDHPYHGMYQVWAGQNTKPNAEDEAAVSRQKATTNIGKELSRNAKSTASWTAVDKQSRLYCNFAAEREKYKSGMKITISSSPGAAALDKVFSRYKLPPPTMQIELSVDRDYSRMPIMVKLDRTFSIASGISAPKIITVLASNGRRYRQLVKGGADDLRQDAIMEQVFAQVSELLKENSATRQRNLGIRTYKVMPLSSTAGVIEFVSNTIPLHDFLMPAHEKYYPKDIKSLQCRKEINEVQQQKLEVRYKKFVSLTERFHPVLRYFYLERFPDPDEWFAKRQAYTRSTAAISMLGHVLGLGDRHGHNILLDEKTGEVVHIDLGVAFEMGRILPIPELVPFRLTRDIVDGMGITKTEGVFRRCCEFTLEALRKEADTIMTILDVLRYDPLYTWSISPVRLAKLQEGQSAVPVSTAGSTATNTGLGMRKEGINEPSEADRALTVVRKKLSKGLSVTAMVNELINQATDERNLAVLYSGWAAYA